MLVVFEYVRMACNLTKFYGSQLCNGRENRRNTDKHVTEATKKRAGKERETAVWV